MKSEERHALQKNDLASALETRLAQAKPIAGWIILVIVLLVGGGFAWVAMNSLSAQREASAWSSFYIASGSDDIDQLTPLIDDYPNSKAAGWAKQTIADQQLQRGSTALMTDRDEGNELIKQAIAKYEAVLAEASDPMLKLRARFGLAQAHESLGDVEKATSLYQELLDGGGTEQFTKEIKSRLDWLKSDASKDFFTKFAAFKPAPKPELNLPSDFGKLPSMPDLTIPEAKSPASDAGSAAPLGNTNLPTPPPAGEAAPAAPAAETPSISLPTPPPPATEPPAAEAPAAEAPAAPAAEPAPKP